MRIIFMYIHTQYIRINAIFIPVHINVFESFTHNI